MDLNYIDAVQDGRDIICWTRDLEGNLETFVEPASDYTYMFIPDNTGKPTPYKDMYGVPMKQIFFKNSYEMKKYAKTANLPHESDLETIYKFLNENFSDAPSNIPYNIGYYDIEVDFDLDDGNGYPSVKDPFGEINGISLFDKKNEKYVMFMLYSNADSKLKVKLEDKEDDYPVDERFYISERELLYDLSQYIDHIDVLTGWNSTEFDLPYIIERSTIVFGAKQAESMYCRDGLAASKREYTNDCGEEVHKWVLKGRHHLDMMELYMKFIPKKLESYSLENVCQEVLGRGKLPYAGDLGKLYREDPQTFFDYSLHDSRLLLWLDTKVQLISQAMSISHESCALPKDVSGSIKIIELDFMKFCRKKDNIVLPDRQHHEKEKYDGAVVYDTVAGLHGLTFGIDLRSLYPFAMITLGMSPETMIMQCKGEYEDYVHVITKDDSHGKIQVELIERCELVDTIEVYPSELEAMIREEGYTISGSGTIYNGELGLLAEYLTEGFKQRTYHKKLKKEAAARGDKTLANQHDLKQKVIKIGRLNAVYGASGNEMFRLYHINMAKSTTLTAQIVSKHQAMMSDIEVEKVLERYI